jgi:hypothetical protein
MESKGEARCQVKWNPTQDSILFIVGLAGIIHETAISDTAEPVLIAAFCAMCGLPFVRAKDR